MRPILKWIGGKSTQTDKIIQRLCMSTAETYIEPFVGGGAVFFTLASRGLLPREVLIADVNPRLCGFYLSLRDEVEDVISALSKLTWGPGYVAEYECRRAEFNRLPPYGAEHAALMIWLNQHCFNGLWRENKKGCLNAYVGLDAKGQPKAIQVTDAERLRKASAALKGANIVCGDFDVVLKAHSGPGVRVYADPPYVPRDEGGFVRYSSGGFGKTDQERLVQRLRSMAATGSVVVASNHDVPVVREMYKEFDAEVVMAARKVNSNGKGRAPVAEVLMSLGSC